MDLFILLKPKILFRGKMTLVDWHNHDNRLDNNNQIIYLKTDLSVSCKYNIYLKSYFNDYLTITI